MCAEEKVSFFLSLTRLAVCLSVETRLNLSSLSASPSLSSSASPTNEIAHSTGLVSVLSVCGLCPVCVLSAVGLDSSQDLRSGRQKSLLPDIPRIYLSLSLFQHTPDLEIDLRSPAAVPLRCILLNQPPSLPLSLLLSHTFTFMGCLHFGLERYSG